MSRSRHAAARVADVPGVLHALLRAGHLCSSVSGPAPSSHSAAALAAAVQRQAAQKAAVLYDIDALRTTFSECTSAFPSHFVHALAIKSAPMAFIVDEALEAGLGIEAASFGEAASAIQRGCPPAKMYFDSPAKTVSELRWALELGLSINADSVEELKRIDAVLTERGPSRPSSSTIGLRVNPIVHGGSIGIFAVSNSPDGKFGHPLHSREARDAVLQAFTDFPWLCGLHAHVGSAGTSLPMLATGASTLVELARDVDEHCSAGSTPRVTMLDIGGGLASNMDSELVTPTFGEYAQVLERAAPSLFSDSRRTVVTEFGRALTSKAGWVVSQVEYAKEPRRRSEDLASSVSTVEDQSTSRASLLEAAPTSGMCSGGPAAPATASELASDISISTHKRHLLVTGGSKTVVRDAMQGLGAFWNPFKQGWLLHPSRRDELLEALTALTGKAASLDGSRGPSNALGETPTEGIGEEDAPVRTAICHIGADLLLRACYRPDLYAHRITAYDSSGEPLASRRARAVDHNLAGPLCFAGDYFQKGVSLPSLEPGDFVVVHDAGANTIALWSRHCSRLRPPVYTYERDDEGAALRVSTRLEAERLETVLDFWGGGSSRDAS